MSPAARIWSLFLSVAWMFVGIVDTITHRFFDSETHWSLLGLLIFGTGLVCVLTNLVQLRREA